MKEMLTGNNRECFLRSASYKITWSNSSRLQCGTETQATTCTLPIVLLQSTVSSASDKRLSKNISSSSRVIYYEKQMQYVYQFKAPDPCKGHR